jgi:Domain of Unknown Function (DUF1080)/FHA domain
MSLRTLRPRHSRLISITAASLLVVGGVVAEVPISYLSPDVAAQGWIQLFDGTSHYGWTSGGGLWQVNANALVSDSAQPSGLRTTASFSDFDLKFEARVTGGSATLLLRADPQSKPAQPGYVLSLNDGTIAGINSGAASTASSGWSSYEVRADGAHLVASLNGETTADGKSTKNRVGYFEFAAARGTRLEVRSILLKPLSLDALYNGADLDGWKAVSAPAPENKSKLHLPIPGLSGKPKAPPKVQWTGQSTIHGHGGVGQLESDGAYDDFVLQVTAKTARKDEHNGVEMFFRGVANQFDSGYAVSGDSATDRQLHDGKSFGIGGLIKLQKARAAFTSADQYFTCTVVARAHRLSVWMNGTLISDYYDARPEGSYHAGAGPLGFRLENDNAAIDIRDVNVASLPKGPEAPTPPAPVATVARPAATVAPAGPAPASIPIIVPSQSPQEKAQQEQIRKLTVDALSASTPDDAVRINKQILVLDPGDMPAQQRLDKAQTAIDAANAQREQGRREEQASTAKMEANSTRRRTLLLQTQDALLHGNPNEAQDRLNDAERLGASGPEVDRLHTLIRSRIRNRLLLCTGLGGGGALVCLGLLIVLWRRRGNIATAYLVALDGVDKGKRYLLNQEVTHIGGVAMDGGKKNEVLVRDPDRQVSRFHCEVHKRGNNCYLIDLDSSNGTFLHSRPLQAGVAAKLREGDKFTLARAAAFELRVERRATKRRG